MWHNQQAFSSHLDGLQSLGQLEVAWPETAASDVVAGIAIAELRRALGDTAQASRDITTVQRRGYRFVAPVTAYTEASPRLADAPLAALPDTFPQRPMTPLPPVPSL